MITFDVIDNKTGESPNLEKIALNEEWACDLVYCDITGFALTDDGYLVLFDDCGNMAFPPVGRFTVTNLHAYEH